MQSKKIQKIFYVILTLAFFYFIFRYVDLGESLELVKQTNKLFLILALIVGVINSVFISYRIKSIFSVFAKVSVGYFFYLSYFGSFVSLVFPFSLGGFSMAGILSKKLKISYLRSLTGVMADFLSGIFIIALAAPVALYFFYKKNVISVSFDTFYILVACLVIITLTYLKRNALLKVYKFLSVHKNILLKVFLISFISWLLATLQFYLYLIAFDLKPVFYEFLLANSLLSLLMVIPGTPAKIGQYETFGLLTLPYLLGFDKNALFGVLLVMRVLSSLIILGLGYYSSLRIKVFDFDKMTHK